MKTLVVAAALLLVPAVAHAGESSEIALEAEGVGSVRQLRLPRLGGTPDEVTDMAAPFTDASGGVALGLGVHPTHPGQVGAMARLRYEMGSIAPGLRTHTIFAGGDVHYEVAPWVFVTGGARIGYLVVERATVGPVIQHWGIGVDAGLSFEPFAIPLFIRPEVDATLIPHELLLPRTLLWGGSIGIGARFGGL